MSHTQLMTYHWQNSDWPCFVYDAGELGERISLVSQRAGLTRGIWQTLPDPPREESLIDMMLTEALQTSQIEGENLDRDDVRSSLRRELGLEERRNVGAKARGIAKIMVENHRTWSAPLEADTLFAWHRLLRVEGDRGTWRTGNAPMRVLSGPIDNPTVWYEAPPSARVPNEMKCFLETFTRETAKVSPDQAPVGAAIAHLWFESIHPFDDGNGRIGRAIAEKRLAMGFGSPQLLSLSHAILEDKGAYYHQLREAQQGNPVTKWVVYFLDLILRAQENALEVLQWTVWKTRYFDRFRPVLNERQLKAVARMFAAGPPGFEGGMTTRKYARLTGGSKPTATRDLTELAEQGALIRGGAGRSVRYDLPRNSQ